MPRIYLGDKTKFTKYKIQKIFEKKLSDEYKIYKTERGLKKTGDFVIEKNNYKAVIVKLKKGGLGDELFVTGFVIPPLIRFLMILPLGIPMIINYFINSRPLENKIASFIREDSELQKFL